MIKNAFFGLTIFALGFFASEAYRYQSNASQNDQKIQLAELVSSENSPHISTYSCNEVAQKILDANSVSNKIHPEKIKAPKTSYEVFKLLTQLDSSSAKDLKAYLAALGYDNPDVRNQVAWLLSAKYPTDALDYTTTLMNAGDVDLSKVILQSVGQNHAKLAWDWINANGSDMDNIYKNTAEKYDAKLFVLNMLARIPEEKWAAYEEAKNVIASSPQKVDKFRLMTVANNAASSDPQGAIQYALSGANGVRDSDLFNGAVVNLVEKDVLKAKDLVLQNQDVANMASVNNIAQKLIKNNQFNDAYNLANSFTAPEQQKNALQALGGMLVSNGLERTKEFASTIKSDDLRYEVVNSIVISMAVNGQPVKDQLALMDSSFGNLSVEKKGFNYAYTIRDWPNINPAEYSNYMSDLRVRDKPLADAIEVNSKYVQKK